MSENTPSAIVHVGRHGAAQRTRFGYLTDDHPTLDRVQNAISAVCGTIAGVAVVAITVLTLAEAIGRSVFDAPLGWSVAFIEQYLLTAAAFFGLVTAYRGGAHVAVISLYEKARPPVQKALLVFAYLVVLVGLIAIGYAGLQGTLFAIDSGEAPVPGSSELGLPSWMWRSFVPMAALLGIVVVAIDLYRELTSPWTGPTTDYDPGDEVDHALEEAQQ